MKKIVILLFLYANILSTLSAQIPEWLDPNVRTAKYPEKKYLTALVSEIVGKKVNQTDVQNKLTQIAKNQISESILVSISSQSEMTTNIQNTKTDESFNKKSLSSSDVELVGLKLENYYDKKKKTLIVFAAVSIDELAKYHNGIISSNKQSIEYNLTQLASFTDKDQKLAKTAENKILLKGIEKSVQILSALSRPYQITIAEFEQISQKNGKLHVSFLQEAPVTVGNIATFLSNELLYVIGNGVRIDVAVKNITYENSGVFSPFSNELKNKLVTALSGKPQVGFAETAKGKFTGTFGKTKNAMFFRVNFTDESNRLLAQAEVNVPEAAIKTDGLNLLPQNFELIPKLSAIVLKAPTLFQLKPSEFVNKPFVITCLLDNKPLSNLNLIITLENKGKVAKFDVISDDKGLASLNLNKKMVQPGESYLTKVSIDLNKFLNVASDSKFIADIKASNTIPEAKSEIKIIPPSVFVKSVEKGYEGNEIPVKVIEPALKAGLSDLRYTFVDSPEKADYWLTVESVARKGQVGDIATIGFVDAVVSLVEAGTNEELYKNSFNDIKGLGADYADAMAKAYQKAKVQLVEAITYELEYRISKH